MDWINEKIVLPLKYNLKYYSYYNWSIKSVMSKQNHHFTVFVFLLLQRNNLRKVRMPAWVWKESLVEAATLSYLSRTNLLVWQSMIFKQWEKVIIFRKKKGNTRMFDYQYTRIVCVSQFTFLQASPAIAKTHCNRELCKCVN